MKAYLVKFDWMKPYPKDKTIRAEGSSLPTAVSRATRQWKKEEGRGVKQLTIKVTQL